MYLYMFQYYKLHNLVASTKENQGIYMGDANSKTRGQIVYDSSNPSSRDHYWDDGYIIYCHTRASRLGSMHGSYSWAVTSLVNVVTLGTSDPLEHWWTIIETKGAYYTIQKWKSGAIVAHVVTPKDSTNWTAANETGLCCAGKDKDATQWNVSAYCGSVSNLTIGQVIDGIKVASTNYNFLNSNCQDFCVILYNLVINRFKSKSSGRYPNAILGFIPLGLKD